jgi:hypothetical protein
MGGNNKNSPAWLAGEKKLKGADQLSRIIGDLPHGSDPFDSAAAFSRRGPSADASLVETAYNDVVSILRY